MAAHLTGAKRGRVLRRVALGLAAVVVTWLLACFLVVVRPDVDRPTKVDAVVVLGPPGANDRLDLAVGLVRGRHLSANLVISVPADPPGRKATCPLSDAAVAIRCFQPDPPTTRGEAEYIGALAREFGWTSLLVVTSTYHISRSRLIFGRCFDGRLEMVAARDGITLHDWAYQFFYQTGGFVKALTKSGC